MSQNGSESTCFSDMISESMIKQQIFERTRLRSVGEMVACAVGSFCLGMDCSGICIDPGASHSSERSTACSASKTDSDKNDDFPPTIDSEAWEALIHPSPGTVTPHNVPGLSCGRRDVLRLENWQNR